ncbi:hypothetical protein LAU_0188 [Lausannevirus]|uniref:Uncharacterized protein n=2 Tax=Lausannevirus TaxID=999883 RepID=A0A0N9PYY1_9VIRU|nr:hypothetical protein LAU_0188 [Lausannevirus]AEA07039.1 hypothetical protein LAU_0188 [Lausannevirus]ALH06865.1 hypothetical protein PMV_167 [Port-miou virus]
MSSERAYGYSFFGEIQAHGKEKDFEQLKSGTKDIILKVLKDPDIPKKKLYFGVNKSWLGKGYETIWFTFDEECYGQGKGYYFCTWETSLELDRTGRTHRVYFCHNGIDRPTKERIISKCFYNIL